MRHSLFGRHLFATFLRLFMVSTLLGCSLYPDVNSDPAKNNKATFRQDALDCAQAYPETGSGVHVRQRINCMNIKGWH